MALPDKGHQTDFLPGQAKLSDAVYSICNKVHESDRVIPYFATHGKTAFNATFLSAYDATNRNNDDVSGWLELKHYVNHLIISTPFNKRQCYVHLVLK